MRIFIGYDSREPLAYHVLSHSILRRASMPVSIQPVALSQLQRYGWSRSRGPDESTEFAVTRFLVPWLADYRGWAVFMDCDMLCLTDISELEPILDQSDKDLLCVQHDYTPSTTTKFMGQRQTQYPRKNWSSFMALRCDAPGRLTLESVASMSAMALHRLAWIDDERIGALPLEWNWLVGEYPACRQVGTDPVERDMFDPAAWGDWRCHYAVGDCLKYASVKFLHYTLGGPWLPETADCDHADLWRTELDHMMGKPER